MTSILALQDLFAAGRFGDVVRAWDQQDRQIQSDPDTAYLVAAAHFRLGDHQRAREICELIEGPFHDNASFLSLYASILRRQGLMERAQTIFTRALDLQPNDQFIQNNYANLLIDQKHFDEAKAILDKIVNDNPNYDDAKNNLKRLEEIKASIRVKESQVNSQSNSRDKSFIDPLDEAFEVDEVIKCGAKVGSETASLSELVGLPSNSELEQADLEMLELAVKQVETKQYRGAIELCLKVRSRRGPKSSIYKIISDALIGLENFHRAEVMALTAVWLGEETVANFINLSSLASMRKDQMMARVWLEKAKSIDPKNEAVKQCEDMIFPEGKTRGEDHPVNNN